MRTRVLGVLLLLVVAGCNTKIFGACDTELKYLRFHGADDALVQQVVAEYIRDGFDCRYDKPIDGGEQYRCERCMEGT